MAHVLFVTPHQDDETLSMGPAIRRHVEAGHDVHVLLLTSGVNSGARAKTGLSRSRFTAARDDELRRACDRLGVDDDAVHLARHSCPDGALTQQLVEDSIRAYLDDVGDAWVKTYSQLTWPGRHADHINTGQAAVALFKAGVITNLRLYVEPWQMAAVRSANTVSLSTERADDRTAVLRALDEYTVADRANGRFGIGYLSVPAAFNSVRAELISYCHRPPGS